MRILVITLAMVASVASPVLANQCPQQIAALDDMIRQHGSMMTPQQQAQVRELRSKAQEAHRAGRHQEALQAVQQAHKAMGM